MKNFFRTHEVFTIREARKDHGVGGTQNPDTLGRLLRYHKQAGHILQVRKGLYVSIPEGIDPASFQPDPFLVAAKLTDDAAVGYHSALELHGKAHSVFHELFVVSRQRSFAFEWRGVRYRAVRLPANLLRLEEEPEVVTLDRSGMKVRVTSLERTLVDILDKPHYGGEWEEIWRSLEAIGYLNPDRVIAYTRMLGVATTAAKVGFLLDQQRSQWMITEDHLNPFREMKPKQPQYLDRKKGGKLVREWNLIVPEEILNQSWTETS